MGIVKSSLFVLGLAAIAGLAAGCDNGGGGVPATRPALSIQTAPETAGFRVAPGAQRQALLYVSDLYTEKVVMYSYATGAFVGVLSGFSAVHYECVDSAGDVFIADGTANELREYAHGGTEPIKTYQEPGFVHGCAIDRATGTLAVLHDAPSFAPGGISIYLHAQGKPKEYTTPNVFRVYFLGYDGSGNLYVNGSDVNGVAYEMAKMPANGNTFKAITLDQSIVFPGAIQWDGKHLAVGDQVSIYGPSKIYEFAMSGSTGKLVHTTPLSDSCDVLQFWIQGDRVIASNVCAPHVLYFNYPQGGTSIKTISRGLKEPVGVAVSP